MIEHVLGLFPPRTHALTIVSDPDAVLADEAVLAGLAERGFRLIREADPVALRSSVERAKPFAVERPIAVVTDQALDTLPYDLWQQGHHVGLSLSAFFPNLSYPVVRALAPSQRWRLSRAPQPASRLGARGSVDFVLRHVFGVHGAALAEPAGLIRWLSEYHRQAEPMPPSLSAHVLTLLRSLPAYAGWQLDDLLASRDAFASFVRTQWAAYVEQQTGELLRDRPVAYLLPFERDEGLQDAVAGLVRTRTIEPVGVERPDRLPRWARPGVLTTADDRRGRRAGELLETLVDQLAGPFDDRRWIDWQAIARAWAELSVLVYAPGRAHDPALTARIRPIQEQIDGGFVPWLRRHYAALGSQRLPIPHHVHHIPHFIAFECRQRRADRRALVVLDGLPLAAWQTIGSAWRARHPAWHVREALVLAQVPTITAVSRQALVAGLRPADFGATMADNRTEPRRWADFWAREGLPAEACPFAILSPDRADAPAFLESARTIAVCLVVPTVDELAHSAELGLAGFVASLRVWLDGQSARLEEIVGGLLASGFTVYLASDHGQVEARGIGQPSEGLTVQTRGRRARIYGDRPAALNVQRAFRETVLWEQDGLLPDNCSVLMPEGRSAFASFGETVVTHGGLTIDEVVVPLVTITLD